MEVKCPDTQAFDFKISFLKQIDVESTSLKIYHPKVGTFTTDEELPFLVSIPVDVTSDSTSFFIDFIYDDGITQVIKTDTITFSYLSNIYLHHQECSFVMNFTITDSLATKNHIDSVSWINKYINEENELNMEIYY